MSFAQLQIITARDVTGGRFTDLTLGGLNSQISTTSSRPWPDLTWPGLKA